MAVARETFGDAPQILDERDAQRDRDRPQLADVERLHALIGIDETHEGLGIEPAVGVRDKGPRHAEDARITLQVAVGELGQLPIVGRRQIVLDLAYLFLDDVEIVEQPLGSRRDRTIAACFVGERMVGCDQNPRVVVHARPHASAGLGTSRDALRSRERFRVLLQSLDTEQLRANGLVGRQGG